jgi:hypothetical protein
MHRKFFFWILDNPEIQWVLAFIIPIGVVYLGSGLWLKLHLPNSEFILLPTFLLGLLLIAFLRYSLQSRIFIGVFYIVFQLAALPSALLLSRCSLTDRCL